MFRGIFTNFLTRLRPPGSDAARARLAEAFELFARQRYGEACALCEAALAQEPKLADAEYLLGVLACHGQDPDSGARAFERALAILPANRLFIAGLADARLLQQREDDAISLYQQAFPDLAADIGRMTDEGQPWKKAHPDWLRSLRTVTLPLLAHAAGGAGGRYPPRFEALSQWHLLNFALLLALRRRVRAAIYLLERVVESHPRVGYAHAALALLYTLNRNWQFALTAARAARDLGTEVFEEANTLCIIAAQFAMDEAVAALDPVFDWRAFGQCRGASVDPLPRVEGPSCPPFPADWLVCLVCCDSGYLVKHAVALVNSIRATTPGCAVCLHLFNPTPEAWSVVNALQSVAVPQGALHVTWEVVDFDRYGGKAFYCSCARFLRLRELVRAVENRVVMLDADSLVRGDLRAALEGSNDIGLVRAPDEPLWHRYLAGFTMFRRAAGAERFLEELAAFLASNLAAGRARRYMDQIGLAFCARRTEAAFPGVLDHLPIEKFCDTLFKAGAVVWSVTQDKDQDSPYARYKSSVLRGDAVGDTQAASPS